MEVLELKLHKRQEMAAHAHDEDSISLQLGSRVQPFTTPSPTPLIGNLKTDENHGDSVKKSSNHSSFSMRLGLKELYSLKVWRQSVAELVGTAALVFAIDTIVISTSETQTKSPNLLMSFLICISITTLLLATIPVSGGHINPVVTFAAAVLGRITFSRALIYTVAQCFGATLGALALKTVVNSSIEEAFSLGGCTLTVISPGPHGPVAVGIDTVQALWIEIICTFLFLFGSIGIAFDARQVKMYGLTVVCLVVGVVLGLLVFISTTITTKQGYAGAGMNPARCIGPAIVRGGRLWDGHWVFWAGPTIACVAFLLYAKIIPSRG